MQGAGNVRILVRTHPSAEQLRGAEGHELAGGDLGREARPESRQRRLEGIYYVIDIMHIFMFIYGFFYV